MATGLNCSVTVYKHKFAPNHKYRHGTDRPEASMLTHPTGAPSEIPRNEYLIWDPNPRLITKPLIVERKWADWVPDGCVLSNSGVALVTKAVIDAGLKMKLLYEKVPRGFLHDGKPRCAKNDKPHLCRPQCGHGAFNHGKVVKVISRPARENISETCVYLHGYEFDGKINVENVNDWSVLLSKDVKLERIQ